jgi:hypothetical protein
LPLCACVAPVGPATARRKYLDVKLSMAKLNEQLSRRQAIDGAARV